MTIQHINGAVAELQVATWFTERGHQVYMPLLTQSKADMVVDVDGTLTKVQVKKATWSKTGPYHYLQTRLKSRNKDGRLLYEAGDFDLLVVTDGESHWHIPFNEIEGLTSLCLASTNPSPRVSAKGYDPDAWLVN